MNYLTCENCWVSANIDNDVKWVWGGLIEWFSVEWTFQYSYVEKNIECIVVRRKNCSKITSAFLKYVYVNYSLAQPQTIIPFSSQTRQDSLTRLERENVWKLNSFVFHLYSTHERVGVFSHPNQSAWGKKNVLWLLSHQKATTFELIKMINFSGKQKM